MEKMNKMPKKKIDFKSLLRAVKLVFHGREVRVTIVILCTIASAIFSTLAMSKVENLIDVYIPNLVSASESGIEANILAAKGDLINYIIGWALLFIGSIFTSTLQAFISVKVSQSTIKEIRNMMFSHMQYLPVAYFDQNKYGDIMSRYTNDVDTLDDLINNTLPNFINVVIQVGTLFFMMIFNNWLLTLVVVVLLSLILTFTGSILKKSTQHFMGRQKLVGKSNGYIEEMMEGTRVVQTFNHQKIAIDEFDVINEEFRQEDLKANLYGNIVGPMNGNLIRIEYVIVALIGAALVLKGNYTIGSLIVFLTYTNSFSNPIGRFSQQVLSIAQASAGSSRIFDLLDREKEQDEGYVTLVNYVKDENGEIKETKDNNHNWAWKHPHSETGDITYTPLRGEIVLDQVDFSYVPEKQILFDISIYANPGQRIALVGETGAGKTTITNLINRFYDIEDGKIRYDGININKIKKADLRKSLGLVLQDTNLFTGTIKENIKLGKADATDEEVIEAAKIANADSFIRQLPNGYDTVLVRAGEQLSQGQRQLLAIARAAIADSPVLILDEATSSIDTRTEQIVQKGMDSLMEGRTVFVIAHRLSTIQNSNAIMVMEHGRIIERGDHKSLIEDKGIYYQLYTGKFELD